MGNPLEILRKFYPENLPVYRILIDHSRAVAHKALAIAAHVSHLHPDTLFIEEAALLHDIGIFLTHAPEIGCFGSREYICHGYLGRELLEKEGLKRHALVSERHIGAGITLREIRVKNLPLPHRNMLPLSLEEKIICYADKFFSKHRTGRTEEKGLEEVRRHMRAYGAVQERLFEELVSLFHR